MRVVAIAAAILVVFAAHGEGPRFSRPADLGAYAVGFDQWQDGGLTVSVWYPARPGGSPMVFGDYLGDRRAPFEAFLAQAGVSAGTIRAYLDAGMIAVRAATQVRRRFPLLLVAQGGCQVVQLSGCPVPLDNPHPGG